MREGYMAQVKFTADRRELTAEEGQTLLPVLLAARFDIPHMCFNEEMHPYGACRLCLVEVEQDGRRRVHTSCSFPVAGGIKVFTDTELLKNHRRMVAELLLARCPEVKEVRVLAAKLGVEGAGRFAKKDEGCILCGLCTRACEQVVGVSVISFVDRGPDKVVGTPFLDKSEVCIGCGSCAFVCPVNYIRIEEDERTRRLPQWKVEFEMARCKKCGQKIAPKKELEFLAKRAKGLPEGWFDVCQNCR